MSAVSYPSWKWKAAPKPWPWRSSESWWADARSRPIAAGLISKRQAFSVSLILLVGGMLLSFRFNLHLGLIIIAYISMNLLYSWKLKRIVILDIMLIALGFVLRAVSGAIVIDVIISPWFLICTVFLALFLGLSKRKNEILTLKTDSANHRRSLGDYSIEMIDQMLSIATSCTIISYALYTFTGAKTMAMMLTIPFVLYGIFRYQYLTIRKDMGGSPESVLLNDLPLIICILLWIISSIIILVLHKHIGF